MQINEEYMVKSESVACTEKTSRPPIRGRVVYIHPQGRYAALGFVGIHGNFRECYFPGQLTEKNRVK